MTKPRLLLRIEYDQRNGYAKGGETHVFKFTRRYARELFEIIARRVEANQLTVQDGKEIARRARELLIASEKLSDEEAE